MKRAISHLAAGASILLLASVARAGPYSSGLSNLTPNAVDPAIPGWVDGGLNPAFVGWATDVISYLPAPAVDPGWNDPTLALGPVTGEVFDIVSLGESVSAPGSITLGFDRGIRSGPGPDFAVFENSFGSDHFVFAELAYVEVSTNGLNFARFPSSSLTATSPGAYGSINPTNVRNLAGKHVNAFEDAYGTPFDLADLAADPLVVSGLVNLRDIRYVRLIDIPGDGTFRDSNNLPIYDAYPTFGSGGFDLEAIGVLNPWRGGDANFDGIVDAQDLGILARNWQATAAAFTDGDFNFDGKVDLQDLVILANQWQTPDGPPPSLLSSLVPEPSLAALALLMMLPMRRRLHS